MERAIDSVEEVLQDVRSGKPVIVVDDESRENEGDIVCPAEKITPEILNLMITHARGLVCMPITQERAKELGIYRAPSTDHFQTAFTESVDALTGSTGISVFDRVNTSRTVMDPKSRRSDFGIPGHVFPIAARPGEDDDVPMVGGIALKDHIGDGAACTFHQVYGRDGLMLDGVLVELFDLCACEYLHMGDKITIK